MVSADDHPDLLKQNSNPGGHGTVNPPLLTGSLGNGLDTAVLADRVNPATILHDRLRLGGADEIICCSARPSVTHATMLPLNDRRVSDCGHLT